MLRLDFWLRLQYLCFVRRAPMSEHLANSVWKELIFSDVLMFSMFWCFRCSDVLVLWCFWCSVFDVLIFSIQLFIYCGNQLQLFDALLYAFLSVDTRILLFESSFKVWWALKNESFILKTLSNYANLRHGN